jgi:glucokinase, proteobacterial type
MLLAGDIGGTKTNLALYRSKEDLRSPVREAKFPSARYATLAALVHDFLSQINVPNLKIERAVFGVAGPVVAGKAKITNLPWHMEEGQLQQILNIPSVTLLNDLVATASSIPLLRSEDVFTLNEGKLASHGTLAIVAPGTGLGEAMLTWDGAHYRVHPSEGGHADFAPTNSFEIGLLIHMLRHMPHVSYEHVCSGIGFPHIYSYFKAAGAFEEPAWLADKLAQAEDKTPVIVNSALGTLDAVDLPEDERRPPEPLCEAVVRVFVKVLGAEAGNMVLKALSTGGLYLGGGIPPRILSYIKQPAFMEAFKAKGRFSDLLSEVPVHVILNNEIGLMGAASVGFDNWYA